MDSIQVYQINISFKQEGYGRQGLYVNGLYLMSIFPNFQEFFNVRHIDDAFVREDENGDLIDEDGDPADSPHYMSQDGSSLDGFYQSKEQYMLDNFYEEIKELLMSAGSGISDVAGF